MSPLLEVDDLRIAFGRSHREVVHGVSFSLDPGERLGLIGEWYGVAVAHTVLALPFVVIVVDAPLDGAVRP